MLKVRTRRLQQGTFGGRLTWERTRAQQPLCLLQQRPQQRLPCSAVLRLQPRNQVVNTGTAATCVTALLAVQCCCGTPQCAASGLQARQQDSRGSSTCTAGMSAGSDAASAAASALRARSVASAARAVASADRPGASSRSWACSLRGHQNPPLSGLTPSFVLSHCRQRQGRR